MKHVLMVLLRALRYSWYRWFFERGTLCKNNVLLESKQGKDLAPNIFYLLKELDLRSGYQLVVVLEERKRDAAKKWMQEAGIRGSKFVKMGSPAYYRYLATCKYLITDTTFPPLFSKRDGQVYLNTWHGTPLKKMGIDDQKDAWAMGNVQRNLLLADYLVFPNEYMEEKMSAAYHLDSLYQGEILRCGYPRNSALLDETVREKIRKDLQVEDKEIFVYMPTWRGLEGEDEAKEAVVRFREVLESLEGKLGDNQRLWYKFHPFMEGKIGNLGMSKVIPFPEGVETYRALAASDVLITDYSSVLFDYANTGRPICLYAYDEERYGNTRGLYQNLDELGLPIARTIEELLTVLGRPAAYGKAFCEKYCSYDKVDAARQIVDRMLEELPEKKEKPGEKVLFFAGELLKNGITTAAMNLLKKLEGDGRQYYFTYNQIKLEKDPDRLTLLPQYVKWLPMCSGIMSTVGDLWYQMLYYYFHRKEAWVQRGLDKMFLREKKRLFGDLHFDQIIQYEGYGRGVTQLFLHMDGRRTIFVHNNMEEELRKKNNQDPLVLRRAYKEYDKVAIVTEDLRESTERLGACHDKVIVVNNLHDAKSIREKGMREIGFDEGTEGTVTAEKLRELLDHVGHRFVTVGRFSEEKGHERLISAFEKIHAKEPDTLLIVIGGYGNLYEKTCCRAQESPARSHIVVLRSLKNPFPIVKACDLFILSSFYEGQGLTLLEADALGIATMSTRVCGPTGFMERYGGYLVENSEEGLIEGMEAFLRGEVRPMAVDYDAYNAEALAHFMEIME